MTMLRTLKAKGALALGSALMIFLMPSAQAQIQPVVTERERAQEVIADAVPDNPEPAQGDTIQIAITIDTRNLVPPDHRLMAYQGRFRWDPGVLQFLQVFPGLPPWNLPNINTDMAASGRIDWSAFNAGGVDPGLYTLLTVRYRVIGAANATTQLELSFSELINSLIRDLLPLLRINPRVIRVRESNLPPVIEPIANQTVTEGTTRNVPVQASDPDGNSLRLTALNFPAFVQLTDNGNGSGQISIAPTLGTAGTYPRLGVVATDNGSPARSDTALFNLIVNPAENPPVLDLIPNQTMNEDDTLEVPVVARDPDGDDIILAVSNLPGFGTLTDNHNGTGVIRFVTGFEHAGVYPNIEVRATDNSTPPLTATRTFTLTVRNVNRAPVLERFTFDSLQINEGGAIVLNNISATDPDGDSLRFSAQNLPTFCQLTDNRNGTASLRIAPGFNDAGNYPNVTIRVTDNGAPNLTDSDAFNLTVADVAPGLVCNVEITAPSNGSLICGDTAFVCLRAGALGGMAPLTSVCQVNGVAVNDSCVKVPLVNGANMLVARCTFTDALGATCTSFDTVTVTANIMRSQLAISAPADSVFICASSISVTGTITRTGGVPPFTSVCTINGNPADSSGSVFGGTVNLVSGYNNIIAACTTTDSRGCSVTARDTVVVFSDPTPATATLNFDNLPIITGELLDPESGIVKVEIIEATNRVVTIDAFTMGDKRVTFSSDKIDLNKRSSFTFRVTNRAGCESIVDPVYVKITAVRGVYDLSFDLLETDRYLFVKNDGLKRIRFLINGQGVTLEAHSNLISSEGSLHYMPAHGLRSINLSPFMRNGENYVDIVCSGPAGSTAELLFSDILVPDGAITGVDAREADEAALPTTFVLGLNFPNPFNPETMISFQVPAGWTAPVTLRIFDVQGQLIRTLVDGVMPPGTHNISWNGKDHFGQTVSTGMYLYQIVSGDYRAVRKMLMAK
ncbi:MAG: Ig-like domain-containing protein [bacterium]